MGPFSLQIAGNVDQPYSSVEVLADDRVILSVFTDEAKRPQVLLETVSGKETLSIKDVAGLLQQVLHVWRCEMETTDHARLYLVRGTDPKSDWIGSDLRTLDELSAFDAMRAFLEEWSQLSGTGVAELLIDLDRTGWRSGMPVNPETWPQWRRAIDAVLSSD